LLIKYIKSVLWRVAKCLSYTEEARCLKVKLTSLSVRIENSSLEMFCLYRVDAIRVMYSNLHSFVPLEIFLQGESF